MCPNSPWWNWWKIHDWNCVEHISSYTHSSANNILVVCKAWEKLLSLIFPTFSCQSIKILQAKQVKRRKKSSQIRKVCLNLIFKWSLCRHVSLIWPRGTHHGEKSDSCVVRAFLWRSHTKNKSEPSTWDVDLFGIIKKTKLLVRQIGVSSKSYNKKLQYCSVCIARG